MPLSPSLPASPGLAPEANAIRPLSSRCPSPQAPLSPAARSGTPVSRAPASVTFAEAGADEEPAAEPVPASEETATSATTDGAATTTTTTPALEAAAEATTTTRGGLVVVECTAQAAEDCRDRIVEAEDIVWRRASFACAWAGVGGAVVLRQPPDTRSPLFELALLAAAAASQRRKVSKLAGAVSPIVRAVLDIEDTGELSRVCFACSARTAAGRAPTSSEVPPDFVTVCPKSKTKLPCFEPEDRSGKGAGHCARGAPFPECALCVRGGARGAGPCAACNCGLRVVAKNTFLTTAEEEIDDDDDEQYGVKKRSFSL